MQDDALHAVGALRVYFVDALHSDVAVHADSSDGAAEKVLAFVRSKYERFKETVVHLLRCKSAPRLQLEAVMAFMDNVRAERVGAFASDTYLQLLDTLLTSKHAHASVLSSFLSKFSQYADCRFYLLQWIASTSAAQASKGHAVEAWHVDQGDMVLTLLDTLIHVSTADEPAATSAGAMHANKEAVAAPMTSWSGAIEAGVAAGAPLPHEGAKARKRRKLAEAAAGDRSAAERTQWASAQAQRQAFSLAWTAFLKLPLPEHVYKRVLQVLTSAVIPRMCNPVLLSDFLTRAIDRGGLIGILSLHGLFVLVTQHGYEYPQFYRRLYNLLTPQIFTARYRLKFLQLTDVFLASSLVPAYTIAAFAKRFARIALTAPPMGAIVCIGFIHNLLRRHPSCTCMLHSPHTTSKSGTTQAALELPTNASATEPTNGSALNPGTQGGPGDTDLDAGASSSPGHDPFDDNAEDPAQSHAIESSLWELAALRCHQAPMVANFVLQLDKDLTDKRKVAEIDMTPLLSESYASQLTQELGKKLRKPPAVAITQPAALLETPMLGWAA